MVNKFYGSVNNESTLIEILYGGIRRQAKRIAKLYGPAEGTVYQASPEPPYIASADINIIMRKYREAYPDHTFPRKLAISKTEISGVFLYSLGVQHDDTESVAVVSSTSDMVAFMSTTTSWGITESPDFYTTQENAGGAINISASTIPVSKLIYQGFGHLSYN